MWYFAYKNTYNEAIFDLKMYVKIGYSGYDSGKKLLLVREDTHTQKKIAEVRFRPLLD